MSKACTHSGVCTCRQIFLRKLSATRLPDPPHSAIVYVERGVKEQEKFKRMLEAGKASIKHADELQYLIVSQPIPEAWTSISTGTFDAVVTSFYGPNSWVTTGDFA